MTRFKVNTPVIPVVVIDNERDAVPLAKTLITAGIRTIEITFRTSAALKAIERVRNEVPDIYLGAGTVMRARQFIRAEHLGVDFVVSPGLTPRLAQAGQASAITYVPGIATPSEVMKALEWEFDALKFFPAELYGGIKALKTLNNLFPDIMFCPTGGINASNAGRYLELANVACVGGSWIAPRQLIKGHQWDQIKRNAHEALARFHHYINY